MSIYTKLLAAKKQIGTVAKNAKNPHFKNTYADINALIEAVEPILLENGLVLLQPIKEGAQYTEIVDAESGEKIESYLLLPNIPDPQKLGSAVTYFRRYTLQSLLGLKAEDDDANLASKPQPTPQPKATPIATAQANTNTPKATPQKQWLNPNTAQWKNAVEKKVTIDEVKKHYSISKVNEDLYLKAIA